MLPKRQPVTPIWGNNDTLDGNLTASVLTTGTVDINTPGTYTLDYTVSDAAGNAANSVTRNVTVVNPRDHEPGQVYRQQLHR